MTFGESLGKDKKSSGLANKQFAIPVGELGDVLNYRDYPGTHEATWRYTCILRIPGPSCDNPCESSKSLILPKLTCQAPFWAGAVPRRGKPFDQTQRWGAMDAGGQPKNQH